MIFYVFSDQTEDDDDEDTESGSGDDDEDDEEDETNTSYERKFSAYGKKWTDMTVLYLL